MLDIQKFIYEYLVDFVDTITKVNNVYLMGQAKELPNITYTVNNTSILSKRFNKGYVYSSIIEISFNMPVYSDMIETMMDLRELIEQDSDKRFESNGVILNDITITNNIIIRGNQQLPIKQLQLQVIY